MTATQLPKLQKKPKKLIKTKNQLDFKQVNAYYILVE